MQHFISVAVGRTGRGVSEELWKKCLSLLEAELPAEKFNMWIRPLQAVVADGAGLRLYAPNVFVADWVRDTFFDRISEAWQAASGAEPAPITIEVGSTRRPAVETSPSAGVIRPAPAPAGESRPARTAEGRASSGTPCRSNLVPTYSFATFVEGKSNQMAFAAAQQVAENPGSKGYNPLLFYGDVGLGKTHLMHAVGNEIQRRNPGARVVYLHSERFVRDMVDALRNRTINEFQRFYRSLDALLIDDIQFFAGKEQSQEEFFHTFNSLLENNQQIILTCDKYPKEIEGLEGRLKSRFGWGLSQPLEPPELETRVAILKKKAEESRVDLPDDAAFFIAQRIRSNVRELEGALRRVIAHVQFTGAEVNVGLVKDALRDLLASHARQVSIDNIQRMVAEYFNLTIADLLSPRRSRSVTRPRQISMSLAKELTSHSYPEIGHAFGGRDHTTVLHACRKVAELRDKDPGFEQDYQNLLRNLTS